MKSMLQKIDVYGQEIKLKTSGKGKFKTWIGGFFALVSFFCLATGTFLFGADFFYKTNPRIISQDKFPDTAEFVYPTNQNFTLSYALEDGDTKVVDPEKLKVGFYAEYRHYKRNQDNEFETLLSINITTVLCSETSTIDNPDVAGVDLEGRYCFDWDGIQKTGREKLKDKEGGSEFRPALGGSWSGDEVAFLGINFGTYFMKGDEVVETSYSEARKELIKDFYYASFNYPSFSFDADSQDRPFNIFYENFFYELNPKLVTTHRNFFKIGKLIDDKGWIFKDEHEYSAVAFSYRQTELGLVDEDLPDSEPRSFYSFLLYFENKQLNYRRNYMKIQELGAIVGGFIKFVNLVLAGSYSYLNTHYRDTFFINRFYAINQSEAIPLANNSLGENNTVVRPARQEPSPNTKKINIGFLKHLCFRLYNKNQEFKREYEAFERARKEIWNKMDADFILQHFNQFNRLKKIMLTESQIRDLERDTPILIGREDKNSLADVNRFQNI